MRSATALTPSTFLLTSYTCTETELVPGGAIWWYVAPWWIARTRCGEFASSKVKVNFPWASVFVWPASSMPAASLMRMTSSPAEGLLVVPLVTVPLRVAAEAGATKENTSAAVASQRMSVLDQRPAAAKAEVNLDQQSARVNS